MCKENVNTDERRLTRDNQPEKRGEKETGEKGGTKRGKNRGDIESAWVLRDRVNESTGQLHGVDCKARSKYSGVLVIRLPFSRSCVLLYEVL